MDSTAGDDGGEGDHRDHEQPGEVFGAAVSVGVAAGGGLGAQREGDPQRYRCQGVGEVVDGVGQQGHRPGDHDDYQLGDRGRRQRHQADLDRPDPGGAGFQRPVDAVGGVVAVRGEHLLDRPSQTFRVIMVVTVVVPVPGAGAVGSASWVMRGVPSIGLASSRR